MIRNVFLKGHKLIEAKAHANDFEFSEDCELLVIA